MPIDFRCTQCNKLLRTADGTAGKQAKCPDCGAILSIPAPEATAAEPPPPADAGSQGPPDSSVPATVESASPFAESAAGASDSENPYQSPAGSVAGFGPPSYEAYPELRFYAAARVSGPAIGLIVVGAIGLLLQVVGTIANMANFAMLPGGPDPDFIMFSGGVSLFFGIVGIVVAVVVIVGGMKMKNLQSYAWAMTASIIVMVPCISPCCLLGLPFGIWALVVLSDGQVQAAFASSEPP